MHFQTPLNEPIAAISPKKLGVGYSTLDKWIRELIEWVQANGQLSLYKQRI